MYVAISSLQYTHTVTHYDTHTTIYMYLFVDSTGKPIPVHSFMYLYLCSMVVSLFLHRPWTQWSSPLTSWANTIYQVP
jgi:hypothetical protein